MELQRALQVNAGAMASPEHLDSAQACEATGAVHNDEMPTRHPDNRSGWGQVVVHHHTHTCSHTGSGQPYSAHVSHVWPARSSHQHS